MYNFNPYSYNTLPVGSIEEAKAAPIDYSGNPVFYYNRAANEVYLKRFDLVGSGKIFFGKYVFEELPEETQQKDEIKEINDKLNDLYKLLSEKESKPKKEKAVKDDE